MERVSNFSRTRDNLAKLGQYFTEVGHTKALSSLLKWPDSEVSLIEPSIGDATALFSFLNDRENITTFGVELDKGIYTELKESEKVDYLINADFLSGMACTNNAFSLCFANPPYGNSEYGERLESLFMKKLFSYLKPKGILVYVIPYHLFNSDEKFAEKFTARFDVEAVYKFHEKEFNKYKQIALIGRRKKQHENNFEIAEDLHEKVVDIDNLELLPMEYDGELIEVYPSSSDNIKQFQTLTLNLEELSRSYKNGKLLSKANILKKVKKDRSLTPPIPPKSGHLYLLGTTGFTSGMIGNEADQDLHLQRGKVNEEVRITHDTTPAGTVMERKKTIKTTSMVLLESCGTITRF
ncbi:MAG: hypothetical protein JEZ08_16470 [Clostridiales bacterium]|nr:hypothetical protein [Clostridiales bacterium]